MPHVSASTSWRLVRYFAVGLVVIMLVSGGTVVAGIASGVINGCYNLTTGVLRVETSAAPCVELGTPLYAQPVLREGRVSWNQIGPRGPKGLNWHGAYNPNDSYNTDDAVSFAGSAWVATGPVAASPCPPTGACVLLNAPPFATWTLLASKGDQGTPGDRGLKGDSGATGPTGPQGLPGPAGLSEAILVPSLSPNASIGLGAGGTPATIASAELPAGNWLLFSMFLFARANGAGFPVCAFRDNAESPNYFDVNNSLSIAGSSVRVEMTGLASLPSRTTVLMECSSATGGDANGLYLAVRLNDVHAP